MSETEPLPVADQDAKYTKKITAARMCGGVIPKPEPGQTIWLFSLYGQIEKIEVGSTEYGDFLRLVGDFLGDSFTTGETVAATSAILPSIAEQIVRNQLSAVGFGAEDGPKTVTFAMDIGVEFSKAGAAGYTWVVKPVGASKKSPLQMYREAIKARRLSSQPEAPKVLEHAQDANAIPDEAHNVNKRKK